MVIMDEALRKPFPALTPADFREHPVWAACGPAGEDGVWFTPHGGALPVDPDEGHYLVRAQATLSDGTWVPACFTPVTSEADACRMLPHLLVGAAPFDLDTLALGEAEERVRSCRARLGKRPAEVWPVKVVAGAGLVDGVVKCTVTVPEPSAEAAAEPARGRRRFWSARR